MENMKAVIVKDIIDSSIAAFNSDGLRVFDEIKCSINKGESIRISFGGIKRCSTQFLNACIGQAYLRYPQEDLTEYIHYDYSDVYNLKEKIEEVIENALHPEFYDSLLEKSAS